MKRLFVVFLCLALSAGSVFAQKAVKGSVSKAKSALEKKDLATAKAEIDKAFEVDKKGKVSKNPNSWFVKGKIYVALAVDSSRAEIVNSEDLKTGVNCLDKAVEMKEEKYKFFVDQEKQNLRAGFFNAGAAKYENEDYAGATKDFQYCLDVIPKDSLLLYYAGISASSAKLYPEALELYDKLIKEFGANENVWTNKIYIQKTTGDTLAALKTAREATLAFPSNSNLAISEIQILLEMNKLDEAKKANKESIAKNPTNPTLYYALGYINESQNARDESIKAYEKAVELKPDYYDAYINLGVVYYDWGRDIKNEANAMDWKTYEKKGKAVEAKALERFKQALPYFEKAHEVEPKNPGALEAMMNCYNVLQMTDKAQAAEQELNTLGAGN
ncbi:MAG: tetratricopeptide repeat protein [Cytophagales bacterium]|nr:tetratricopeptide repeat protein [Cytophagales bacterium]